MVKIESLIIFACLLFSASVRAQNLCELSMSACVPAVDKSGSTCSCLLQPQRDAKNATLPGKITSQPLSEAAATHLENFFAPKQPAAILNPSYKKFKLTKVKTGLFSVPDDQVGLVIISLLDNIEPKLLETVGQCSECSETFSEVQDTTGTVSANYWDRKPSTWLVEHKRITRFADGDQAVFGFAVTVATLELEDKASKETKYSCPPPSCTDRILCRCWGYPATVYTKESMSATMKGQLANYMTDVEAKEFRSRYATFVI